MTLRGLSYFLKIQVHSDIMNLSKIVLVLLSISVKRFNVSRMRNFFYNDFLVLYQEIPEYVGLISIEKRFHGDPPSIKCDEPFN